MFERSLLFGRWYRSELTNQGIQTTEHAQMNADGSFEFSFIEQDSEANITEQYTELGDWGLVGDIHFTITQAEENDGKQYAADLTDENNYHAYQVLQLDSQVFKYQHIVTKEVFILRRVIDKIAHC
jgi:hypothetical protein